MSQKGTLYHVFVNYNFYNLKFRNFILENFGDQKHVFVFRTKKSEKHKLINGKNIFASNFIKLFLLIPKFVSSKNIYIHYLPNGPSILFWALFFPFHKKIVWVYWGGDIYQYTLPRKKLIENIYEKCRRIIIRRIKYIAGFLPGDFDLIRQWYGTKAKYIPIIYPLPVPINFVNTHVPTENSVRQILVGNSADPSNNHLEAFTLIEKYKTEPIRVVCPLSYGGTKDYIEKVIKKGFDIFGDKFVPLTEFMEANAYNKILTDTHIAIMFHNRQQGLGNILPLLSNYCKVFVKPQITTFTHFTQLNLKLFSTEEIANLPFADFYNFENSWGEKNVEIIKEYFSDSTFVYLWAKALNL